MDHYVIMEDVDFPCSCPFPEQLSKNVLRFELKKYTKIGRVLQRVEKEFQKDDVRRLIFEAIGADCCERCISCVEVLKKRFEERLFQWNVLKSAKSVDIWGPTAGEESQLDRIQVEKRQPSLFILVSRDPFPQEFHSASHQQSDDCFPSFLAKKATKGDGEEAVTTKHQNQRMRRRGETAAEGTTRPNKWRRPERTKAGGKVQQQGRTAGKADQ